MLKIILTGVIGGAIVGFVVMFLWYTLISGDSILGPLGSLKDLSTVDFWAWSIAIGLHGALAGGGIGLFLSLAYAYRKKK